MNDFDQVVEALQNARHVAALTGAGISAESGLPTFRDPLTGHWARFKPEDLATPQAFMQNPARVWQWYMERRQMIHAAKPNPGHFALAWLETKLPDFTLITQNVDGLHALAGSKNLIELHGNIHSTHCFDNAHPMPEASNRNDLPEPPACSRCNSLGRPGVVWFGEMLPDDALNQSIHAARSSDLFLVIGTSGQVQPAASLASLALASGARVCVINPDQNTRIPGAFFLTGPSGVVLPKLIKEAWNNDDISLL